MIVILLIKNLSHTGIWTLFPLSLKSDNIVMFEFGLNASLKFTERLKYWTNDCHLENLFFVDHTLMINIYKSKYFRML